MPHGKGSPASADGEVLWGDRSGRRITPEEGASYFAAFSMRMSSTMIRSLVVES